MLVRSPEKLYELFRDKLGVQPTSCQDRLMRETADFLTGSSSDIMIVDGYAGTGKTTVISAIVNTLLPLGRECVLLAPTGRAAKVFSRMSGQNAATIHKHIYRQKSVGADGFGKFTLAQNEAAGALFIVDEVSLIGIAASQEGGGMTFGSGDLLDDLVTFVRSGRRCRLMLVGDSAQLPPVGLDASPALSPEYMSEYGEVVHVAMESVVRQAAGSGILVNAGMVRGCIAGSVPEEGLKLRLEGFEDIERVSGGELIDVLSDAYSRYGEYGTVVLCRSNKRAIRYNMGIRSRVLFKEERLNRGDRLMIVKNNYTTDEKKDGIPYIANGDIATLEHIGRYKDIYGFEFVKAELSFPDYDDAGVNMLILLDTLVSESPSLTYEQQNALYTAVSEDYSHIKGKHKRWMAVREDPYYNALQVKYAEAITCHKSQGGQWDCVFIDCPFWQDEISAEDLKWLYTALTRAVKKVYLVNFPDKFFV